MKIMVTKNNTVTDLHESSESCINNSKRIKKRKKSKRCTNCKKKKGAYLLVCKCCNKKFCISCLDVMIHSCEKKEEYLQNKRKKLESELKSANSNFLKIDKI